MVPLPPSTSTLPTSLDSESSYLDLYPGFQYAETASMSEEEWGGPGSWRRSSAPLLDPWDDPPG